MILQSFFAERFFKLFDKDNSGTISLKELMDGLSLLTNGSELDKLNFLFQVYDVDGMKVYYSVQLTPLDIKFLLNVKPFIILPNNYGIVYCRQWIY